jgi:hypothetical protein
MADVWLDIGHGVAIALRHFEGQLAGVAYTHPKPDGSGPCKGPRSGADWVPVKPHDPIGGWDLVSKDPLTLSPSLLCRACGHHGFIRDGRWHPA